MSYALHQHRAPVQSAPDDFINLKSYRFPGRSNVITVYRDYAGGLPFDIADYEMLFQDPATRELIRSARTIGCFYIESPGMRSLIKRLGVDTFELLVAASSIIRPGVAESGMMQEFILRHQDPGRRKYLVPEMEKILGETYGVMIYQEDVIKVVHHIAGMGLDEADLLRRAMSGKMRSPSAMLKLEQRYYESCASRGLNRTVAEELWRQIKSFAGYAFCKSHSASFALLSYQVAYLKAHYPAEFMASVLSNSGGYYTPAVYVQEAKRMGVKVLLPCVNASEYEYTGSDGVIRIGLMAVKNLSVQTARCITDERSANGYFVSLLDFLRRTHTGYETTKLLITCGAMDSLGETRRTLLRLLDVYIHHRRVMDDPAGDLFAHETLQLEREVRTPFDFTIEEKCLAEHEIFDYMVTLHPLEFFPLVINDRSVVQAKDLVNMHNRRVKMAGWFMASKRIKTSKGDIMKFLSLEDLTGTFEAVLFPKVYERYAVKTLSMGPYVIEGRVDSLMGNNIIVDKLEVLPAMHIKAAQQWDSAEKQYTDNEKITEEEVNLVGKLGAEKLLYAYAG